MADEYSDLTEEERKNVEIFNEYINDYKKSSKTKIEKVIDFENELDKWVWDRLPLSNAQKEEMLYEIYIKDNNIKNNNVILSSSKEEEK